MQVRFLKSCKLRYAFIDNIGTTSKQGPEKAMHQCLY